MNHSLFVTAVGTLTLINLSMSAPASAGNLMSVWNQPIADQEIQINQSFPLLSLELSSFQRVAQYLTEEEAFNLAQVSKYCLGSVSSQLNLELYLEKKMLFGEDFLHYFGEDGIYKDAQCLSLSGGSSFIHPTWLRRLPKTLKVLKLRSINTKLFREFGFLDKSTMLIEIVRALGETLPHLRFLDLSENNLGAAEAAAIAQHLTSLHSLNISKNRLQKNGIKEIAKMTSLKSLNISENQLPEWVDVGELAKMSSLNSLNISGKWFYNIKPWISKMTSLRSLNISKCGFPHGEIEEITKLTSLRSLDISRIGYLNDEHARHIAQNLKSLTSLNISSTFITDEGARFLSQLTSLKYLNISQNPRIGAQVVQELREQLPLCQIEF